ncbi:M48 family metallopeptidase [Brachybacterium sp. JHP9]|uniref:M48 family metallopeptidase n=1 Tax=Brachybacterium equifaecis TaxID=2910770 RepID=A0ABT0QWD6_9MICO|nr:M48 family metallopeptidase [Brachybacterium equifaecis]
MAELHLLDGITGPSGERILVRRSARRTRTVSISRREGDIVLAVPARFTRRQERDWAVRMVAQLRSSEESRTPARAGDDELLRMARRLSQAHLEGRAQPVSVSWSARQQHRWGSCTPSTGQIRLSQRLRSMPVHVLEYVLVHELAHLLIDGHGPEFWALVARYPRTESARGFLDGVSFAVQHGWQGGDIDGEQSEAQDAGDGAATGA